jgi:hypothetical protein
MMAGEWIIVLAVVVVFVALGRYLRPPFLQIKSTDAQRRWEWTGGLIPLVWVLAQMALGDAILDRKIANKPKLVLGVLVVAVLGLASIWSMYRWLRLADEFIRKVEIEALALGLGFCTVGIIAMDALGHAGIGYLSHANVEPGGRFLIFMFFGYGLGRVVVYSRYR